MKGGSRPPRAAVWAALGALYLVWGSTYLAIRIAVFTLPPFSMAAVRFLVAGAVLYLLRVRRTGPGERPTPRQWRAAAIVGAALLAGGNGGVVWAEQIVPSGLAALLIATVPLFMVVLDRVVFGQRLSPAAWVGIVVGLGGVGLLLNPFGPGPVDPKGAIVLLGASLAWSAGALYATRADLPANTLLATAMEMLAGGAILAAMAAASGELGSLDPAGFGPASLWAVGYLIVFGSLLAFSAYVWLLKVERTSVVSTYAYVNPVVAVVLGWLVLDERLSLRILVAGALVVGSVALIITARSLPRRIPGNPGGMGVGGRWVGRRPRR